MRARRRSRKREIVAIEIRRMRLRAGRRALIRRARGVALHERHAVERHAELFRNELTLRGVESLPELTFAGVGGDRPSTPTAIQASTAFAAGPALCNSGPGRDDGPHRECDDQRTRALQAVRGA